MDGIADDISVGDWRVNRASGELRSGASVERLEPKTMELLFLLASRPGEAFSKETIMQLVWPGVVVGDDTLARTVSRLRKALGDDARTPRYVETLHKRGYRLIAAVGKPEDPVPDVSAQSVHEQPWRWLPVTARRAFVGVVLVLAMLTALRFSDVPVAAAGPRALNERAVDFYFQYTRADNEAALELFQRILNDYPDYAPAMAGIANALVQKVVRWPDTPGAASYSKLADALRGGATKTREAQELLARAEALAVRASAVAPNDGGVLKALGFVRSAQGRFDEAITTYERAVAVDRDAWGPLINIGDVLEISGEPALALPYFERAYAAMTRVYDEQSARVRPWQAELGILIGDRYRERSDTVNAETWYRKVLMTAPLNVEATSHLASVLRQSGDANAADALCRSLTSHLKTATCGS